MTERVKVTEAVTNWKAGQASLERTVEVIAETLALTGSETEEQEIEDILTETEGLPISEIVGEIDLVYYLDEDIGDDMLDEEDEDDDETEIETEVRG